MSDQAQSPPPATVTTVAPSLKEESGFYEPYAYFARNLRTWFVAYGIGGPVVFLTNESASRAVFSLDIARPIAWLFLGGVALQIVTTMLYKTAMWYQYMSEIEANRKRSWQYMASEWLTDRYWPEAVLDLSTVGLFGWATLLAVEAIVP